MEELVSDIRYCVSGDKPCGECKHIEELCCDTTLLEKAADAIEGLQKDLERSKEYEAFWQKEATEALKKFQVAVASKPRWIPVTELPPEGETYGDTTFSVEVLGTEGFTYRKAYYNFKYKVWLDGNEEWEWPSITHWMYLPEPPKEETE